VGDEKSGKGLERRNFKPFPLGGGGGGGCRWMGGGGKLKLRDLWGTSSTRNMKVKAQGGGGGGGGEGELAGHTERRRKPVWLKRKKRKGDELNSPRRLVNFWGSKQQEEKRSPQPEKKLKKFEGAKKKIYNLLAQKKKILGVSGRTLNSLTRTQGKGGKLRPFSGKWGGPRTENTIKTLGSAANGRSREVGTTGGGHHGGRAIGQKKAQSPLMVNKVRGLSIRWSRE